jgi:hypothetical protein
VLTPGGSLNRPTSTSMVHKPQVSPIAPARGEGAMDQTVPYLGALAGVPRSCSSAEATARHAANAAAAVPAARTTTQVLVCSASIHSHRVEAC